MSPSLKKLCVYGLAGGIGKLVLSRVYQLEHTSEEKELLIWNSNQIIIACEKAISSCNVSADNSKIRQAGRKIDEACMVGGNFNIVEMLSFLFLGLTDLSHHCKDKETIKALEDIALNFTTIYDPNLEDEAVHAAAMERYEQWIQ